MRLRPLIRRGRQAGDAVAMVDEPVTLARTIDAIGPMQAGIEPLRRVGRAELRRQHEAEFVIEGAGVLLGVEIAALPAPVGPGSGHAMEKLPGTGLAAVALVGGQRCERTLVRGGPPQPLRHVALGDRDEVAGDAGAPEVFLRKYIGGHRRPLRRDIDVALAEDDRAVGIADFGISSTKRHPFEWRISCLRIPTLQTH